MGVANAKRQQELLETGLRLCSRGGRVVYSTCSLSRRENDEVVQRVVRRLNQKRRIEGFVELVDCRSLGLGEGETTECGWHILPDAAMGWGPIYLAVLDVRQLGEQNRLLSRAGEQDDEYSNESEGDADDGANEEYRSGVDVDD